MWQLFTPDSTRAVIADWVELELYRSGRTSYSDASLLRAEETAREPDQHDDDLDPESDDYDPEILQLENEARREEVWEELSLRASQLTELYPFELTGLSSGGWRLALRAPSGDPNVDYARSVYLLVLTMSGVRNRHIKKQRREDPDYTRLTGQLEKQFQHVSALAAANYYGRATTAVYSFGWPRKDRSDYHSALKDLTDKFGTGKVRKRIPANSSGKEKDGTVDIVAWRVFPTPLAGDPVLYGQVASGLNWTDKPVMAYLDGKFFRWFKHPLSTQHAGATFMPFVRHVNVSPAPGRSMREAIAEEDREHARIYGAMVDRIRLTQLLGEGLGDPSMRYLCEMPDDVLARGQEWIDACWSYCSRVN
jgi:hypothetical protein